MLDILLNHIHVFYFFSSFFTLDSTCHIISLQLVNMEYNKCMDDMLRFNSVPNTLKTRSPFAIRRVKQFQFIFHEGWDLGVAWHEDLNFDIMI